MQLRRLGKTDLNISPLGLGTVKFGRNQGVKYPRAFELPSTKEAAHLIALAHDLGVNLLDTAPAYGSSEERLGTLLQGQRQRWVIATKVGEEFVNGESSFHFDEAAVRASIERSLKRLKTDYLDIVQVHSDGNDVHIIEHYGILQQLAELKKEGLIRAYGMSTKTVEGGLLAAKNADMVMLSYNPQHLDELSVLDYCAAHQIGTFIKKAFASGHLCASQAYTIEQTLAFIFAHEGVSSVIAGTLNPQHLKANIAATRSALSQAS